ncbi:hypothetical protein [Nisaea sp.]|uniref:hypothetical protein n=1 Tax=Nisaea sp. TaxID=2024842 RepID=UPI0032ED41AE
MADTDFRTWPAHGSNFEHSDRKWMTPAGRFNRGFTSADQSNGEHPAANQNMGMPAFSLADHLPEMIVDAIGEWAVHLRPQSWRLRRRALSRFAEAFADQFVALNPALSDEEYESLTEIGYTCLLEKLDDGQPISELDQAHCYKRSVHDEHRFAADMFIEMSAPAATIH